MQHVSSSNVTTGTEYAANYRFENGSIAMIHTDAGYYTPVPPPSGSGSPTYMHVWYLKDHLGNNRVLADGTGTALRKHHYDPFGEAITLTGAAASPFPTGATESPYKYGGKEWDSTTSTYDFEARQFSPNFHRFTTMDPLCEKYYGISPYAYCANNPVNAIEKNGEIPFASNLIGAVAAAGAEYASQVVSNIVLSGFSKEAFTNVDVADIGVAAIEGFITSGASIVKSQTKKIAVSIATNTVKNVIDIPATTSQGEERLRINDAETVLVSTIVDYCTLPLNMIVGGNTHAVSKTSKNKAIK